MLTIVTFFTLACTSSCFDYNIWMNPNKNSSNPAYGGQADGVGSLLDQLFYN